MSEEKKQAQIAYIIQKLQTAAPEQVQKMFICATNICGEENNNGSKRNG